MVIHGDLWWFRVVNHCYFPIELAIDMWEMPSGICKHMGYGDMNSHPVVMGYSMRGRSDLRVEFPKHLGMGIFMGKLMGNSTWEWGQNGIVVVVGWKKPRVKSWEIPYKLMLIAGIIMELNVGFSSHTCSIAGG